ncbi:hypothetical protein B0H10DRAFT_300360 [Mycena sp. CBHHK59/15]|nr:hypothetical protein B0H10DRAFT_300360 [Mycena sp. CBHHK59/15]
MPIASVGDRTPSGSVVSPDCVPTHPAHAVHLPSRTSDLYPSTDARPVPYRPDAERTAPRSRYSSLRRDPPLHHSIGLCLQPPPPFLRQDWLLVLDHRRFRALYAAPSPARIAAIQHLAAECPAVYGSLLYVPSWLPGLSQMGTLCGRPSALRCPDRGGFTPREHIPLWP